LIFGGFHLTDMSDALSAIPAAVHRNLSDKLYEKRKNAALEVSIFSSPLSFFLLPLRVFLVSEIIVCFFMPFVVA